MAAGILPWFEARAKALQCPAWRRVNPRDADFCEECAGDLVRPCAACGTTNASTAKFCKRCRAPLATGAAGGATVAAVASASAPAPRPPLPTSFASGRYAVRRFLGEGGRKRVYLAHDEKLKRDVAVSVIKTDGLDAAGLSRVHREAEAMAKLGDQPNIALMATTNPTTRRQAQWRTTT